MWRSVSFWISSCAAALVILRDQFFLEHFLEVGQRIAAHVADADARILGILAHHLGDVAAPLLGQRRQRDADHRAGGVRGQAQVRLVDRLLDRTDHGLLPRRDHQRTRILDADVRPPAAAARRSRSSRPSGARSGSDARARCAASSGPPGTPARISACVRLRLSSDRRAWPSSPSVVGDQRADVLAAARCAADHPGVPRLNTRSGRR